MDAVSIPGITPEAQTLINLFFLAFVGAGGAWHYFQRKPDKTVNPEVEIVGGAFADRQSIELLAEVIREATMQLKRIAETRERMPESLERATQSLERTGDQIQRALNQHGEDVERVIEKHGTDISRKIEDAARYLRSNL